MDTDVFEDMRNGYRDLLKFDMDFSGLSDSDIKTVMSLFDQKDDVDACGDLTIQKNLKSKSIYLIDEDFNCFVIDKDDGLITEWITCPECGKEGILSDLQENGSDCCLEYLYEKGDISSFMTLEDAISDFEENYLPFLIVEYGIDLPAINEEWNNYTDALCKDGLINNYQYEHWVPESFSFKGSIINY